LGIEQGNRRTEPLVSCYYTSGLVRRRSVAAGGEVEVAGGFGQAKRGEDGLVRGDQGEALRDPTVFGGQGDQV